MISAVGAHIYAGGFTVGVARHFNVLAHLEHAAYGAEVVRLNFPDLPIHAGGPASWPTRWPRCPRFVYANPPCAIWSGASAGRLTSWQDDPRLQAHHDIFDYATGTVGADVLAIESVTNAFTRGRPHVDELVTKAAERGYSSTIVLHDARHLGVAQVRKRVFMVFHKIAFSWDDGATEIITVRDALRGVRDRGGYDATLPPKVMALARRVGPGGYLHRAYEELYPEPSRNARGHAVDKPSFLEKRAPWDRPCYTIISGKMIHPDKDRYLTQAETAAICSFPLDYRWPAGTFGEITGYMSRGVMPKVGEWLAGNVRRALEANRRINEPRAEVLDITKPPGHTYALEDDMARLAQLRPPATSAKIAPAARVGKTVVNTGARPPDRTPGEGSGAYIRRLLPLGYETAAILEAVHRQFEGSKAGPSDVNWNRAKLAKEGTPVKILGPRGAEAVKHITSLTGNGAAKPNEKPAIATPTPPVARKGRGELAKIGRALQEIGAALAAMGDQS